MKEIHLTKKDFSVEWFSGQGAGGQHRNKHQNCCRITHKETGLRAQGTEARSRVENQKKAFHRLAKLVLSYYSASEELRRGFCQTVRTYHAVRNEVHDKASGLKQEYKLVVGKPHIDDMVKSRRKECSD